MKPLVTALIVVLTTAMNLTAGNFSSSAIGTTGAGFLNLGMGARPIAMGGAYSAVADDASAVYWNPAGLVRSEGASFMFMHASYLSGISFDYLSFASSKGDSAFGGSLGYMNAGSIDQTDNSGNPLGSYQPRDYCGTLSYAADLEVLGAETGRFSAGLSAKFLSSTITRKAGTVAFDAGLAGKIELFGAPLRLGFVAQNVGPGLKYDNKRDPLPTTYKLGGAVDVSGSWLFSAELAAPRGNAPYLSLGTEHTAYSSDNMSVLLRAGMNTLTLSDISGLNGISGGLGLAFSRVSVDYAVMLFGELGMTHRLSMTLKLGSQEKPSSRQAGKRGGFKHIQEASLGNDAIYLIH
ncbi:MAG: PorV/PorQ family protein [Elusimicrobia bacterium]|nr:PorV/PorQ family protein [Elusimicrobiota bacterium]